VDSIRFTLVSEPPEEEEQERECEDVGVAYLRIPDILEKQQDLMESRLNGAHASTHTQIHIPLTSKLYSCIASQFYIVKVVDYIVLCCII